MRFLVVHELGGELGGEAVRAAECGFAAVPKGRRARLGSRLGSVRTERRAVVLRAVGGAEWRGTEPLEGAHIGRKV